MKDSDLISGLGKEIIETQTMLCGLIALVVSHHAPSDANIKRIPTDKQVDMMIGLLRWANQTQARLEMAEFITSGSSDN